MPIAMTQEQQALQASLRDWAKRTNPIALVRAAASPRNPRRSWPPSASSPSPWTAAR